MPSRLRSAATKPMPRALPSRGDRRAVGACRRRSTGAGGGRAEGAVDGAARASRCRSRSGRRRRRSRRSGRRSRRPSSLPGTDRPLDRQDLLAGIAAARRRRRGRRRRGRASRRAPRRATLTRSRRGRRSARREARRCGRKSRTPRSGSARCRSTATCCSLSRRMMRKMSFASCSVSAAVGSSMTRMRALPGERAGDLDDALLGDREALDQRVEVDRARSRAGRGARADLSRIVLSSTTRKPGPRFIGRSASEMFSATVMSPHHRDFLRQEADAGGDGGARVGEDDLLAVDAHGAGVARVDAGQDLHQRRLAGAVRAEQRHHLAGLDDEVDVVEHGDAAERLADAAHLEAGMRCWRWRRSSIGT